MRVSSRRRRIRSVWRPKLSEMIPRTFRKYGDKIAANITTGCPLFRRLAGLA